MEQKKTLNSHSSYNTSSLTILFAFFSTSLCFSQFTMPQTEMEMLRSRWHMLVKSDKASQNWLLAACVFKTNKNDTKMASALVPSSATLAKEVMLFSSPVSVSRFSRSQSASQMARTERPWIKISCGKSCGTIEPRNLKRMKGVMVKKLQTLPSEPDGYGTTIAETQL